jgi:glycosyltransferase involved in cell wall biosynthesis
LFISISIPAYKRSEYLKRLLHSISIQTYQEYEVIVTDDSPDDEVEKLCRQYEGKLDLRYFRNQRTLGTPENWNEAIRHARGEWIKLMHDDDWFAGPESLRIYSDAAGKNPDVFFIFSAYRNVYLEKGSENPVYLNSFRYRQLRRNPATLFSSNVIGPPSVVMFRNEKVFFDSTLKWLVDIEFYIRVLETRRSFYINTPLINVGIGKEQVTQDCFRQRVIEIPEGFYLLNKIGVNCLRNILVYDAWWRLMRNLKIEKKEDIIQSGYPGEIPRVILSMINWQRKLPFFILNTGIFSKCTMLLNYILNFNKI